MLGFFALTWAIHSRTSGESIGGTLSIGGYLEGTTWPTKMLGYNQVIRIKYLRLGSWRAPLSGEVAPAAYVVVKCTGD
jgi:hypothetical protein